MSTRNKARKSTGTRAAQRPSTSGNNTSNVPNQRKRRSTKANFSLQSLPSSSDSEPPTQPLNIRNHHASPGPSGINRLRIQSSSDSDPDGPAQRPTRTQNTKIVQRPESTSSGPTTSDSDEVLGRESMENANVIVKRKRKIKPTNRKKRTRKPSSSSETDEASKIYPPNVSATKRQSLSQSRNISSLVNKCVYFLLIADQKKHTIKKAEIMKHVFYNQDKKLYGAVIEEANNVLKQTYGMEILTSEKRKGEYILINILNRDLGIQDFVELSPLDLQKQGLVFYLLTIIFMNEKSICENELWEVLKPLGIDATSKIPHPIFGDVRKYITNELVKQMYLEHKCVSKDPPEYEFTWGERAKQEIDKKDLLDFACKIMGDTKPEEWILQYNDAMDIGSPDE